jgi:6-phosphogluconate dehydrogenase
MGMGIAERLIQHGHQVIGSDISPGSLAQAESKGARTAPTLEKAIKLLDTKPRIVWIMVPAGDPVGTILQQLIVLLGEGDIIIEGGNSFYKDTVERATMLSHKGIRLLDAGVSGGIWGLKEGFNLMIGGSADAFHEVEPIFEALAPPGGYQRIGDSGAGHFVKMVHNGIEYGMMQAMAEGLELIRAKKQYDIDLAGLTRLWMNGSVIRSWLLELAGNALEDDPNLEWVDPAVTDSGEGRWTVVESIDLAVPIPVITLALQVRFRSRLTEHFGARLLSALRHQFGGHTVRKHEGSM